ncbi:GNAT family N-acetyltransferase [Dactylosporangium sp. CA-139066]|uniref:GNAT family N-acetyltransferase n=1 Tax=Dactylosporangium sp. CA-139066 TaxID=3239930 RepID=UPI003D8C16D2
MMPAELPAGALLRPIELTDAPSLRETSLRNLDRFRRSSPRQPDSFWTPEGQRERVEKAVARNESGEAYCCVIARDDAVLGLVTLSTIVRGPFCSTSIGYWIDHLEEGRGIVTAAVGAACATAADDLGLHRVEASTLPDNVASQRVLTKNGFEQFGRARDYLFLDGAWQESVPFQRILHDRPPSAGSA